MYTAVIMKVSEPSIGGMFEVSYIIYNDDRSKQWEETASLSSDEYQKTNDVESYIKKRIKFYKQADLLVENLKKNIGKEITEKNS